MAFFDVLWAKKEGYSDQEIADFLAKENNYDINWAKQEGYSNKDIIQFLNKTNATPFQTFLQSAKQEVGSEVKGIAQLAGMELDTAEESKRRQMESENPVAGVLGTLAGGLVNPTTLIPGSFLFKGAKGVAAAGAGAGAISGALQPIYNAEDDFSRLTSTAIGAGGGAVLGGLLGVIGGRFGRQAAADLADDAIKSGAKTEQEIATAIKNKTGIDDTDAETLARTMDQFDPNNKAKVEGTLDVDTPNAAAIQKTDSVGEFKPIFDAMDQVDSVARKAAQDNLNKAIDTGDFTDFIDSIKPYTTPYEFGKIPLFKIQGVLDEGNEFYAKNLNALRQWNVERNVDPIRLLQTKVDDINNLRVQDPAAPPTVPDALQAFLGRDIGQLFDVRYQNVAVEWLQKEMDSFANLDTFYRDMITSGVPEREAQMLIRDSANQFLNVTAQVLGNRSQAGRLLGDKSTVNMFGSLRNLTKMLETGKGKGIGEEDVLNLIDSVSKIKAEAANGSVDAATAITKLAKDLQKQPTLGQKFSELITNIYTSGLQTAVVNAMSPPVKMILNGIENAILTLTPGSSRFLQFRRAGASLSAMTDSFKEALFFGKSGFMQGQALDNLGDVQGAIGRQADASMAERVAGNVVRTIGTRPSVGIDEFFKTYFRKMELYDQYYKLAYSGRFKGRESEVFNALKKVDLKDLNWSENLMAANIRGIRQKDIKEIVSAAREYAKLNTFQADLGKLGNDLLRLKSNNPAAALIIPFVKTPLNILKDGISYTPLGLIPGATPTRIKRSGGKIVKDAEGKPIVEAYLTKEQRVARAAMGMAGMVTLAMHVGNNEITGSYPRDPGKRAAMQAAGIPEYSIKVGDQWIPYGRVEPLATTLGFIADNIRTVQDYYSKNPNDRRISDIALQTTTAMANNLANKTFLQGIAGVVQAINDPDRHGSAFIKGFSSLAVPGVVAQFAKTADESQRITGSFGEAVLNRVPGQREQLPERFNLFGGVQENPMQGVAAFTGMPIRSAEQTAVQKAVADAGVDYVMPAKSLKGVELTSAQQSRYQELSSQFITLKLNSLVNTPGFDNIPKGVKKNLIEKQMREGRSIATKIMTGEMSRDPEFLREAARKKIMKKSGIDIEE